MLIVWYHVSMGLTRTNEQRSTCGMIRLVSMWQDFAEAECVGLFVILTTKIIELLYSANKVIIWWRGERMCRQDFIQESNVVQTANRYNPPWQYRRLENKQHRNFVSWMHVSTSTKAVFSQLVVSNTRAPHKSVKTCEQHGKSRSHHRHLIKIVGRSHYSRFGHGIWS